MEKKKPHFPLQQIKQLIREGLYRITRTAFANAARDFGFIQSQQLTNTILSLSNTDFYKSMTTYHDNTLWQDVYRPLIDDVEGYVKLQIVDNNTVIISFKQR